MKKVGVGKRDSKSINNCCIENPGQGFNYLIRYLYNPVEFKRRNIDIKNPRPDILIWLYLKNIRVLVTKE